MKRQCYKATDVIRQTIKPVSTDEPIRKAESHPRFADQNSFEHEYKTRFEQLDELYKQEFDVLQREWSLDKEKLEVEMEKARFEMETEMLRAQLTAREMESEKRKTELKEKERYFGKQRKNLDGIKCQLRQQQQHLLGAGMKNTCYMKSALKALFHVRAFADWIISDSERCENNGGCIICVLASTLTTWKKAAS